MRLTSEVFNSASTLWQLRSFLGCTSFLNNKNLSLLAESWETGFCTLVDQAHKVSKLSDYVVGFDKVGAFFVVF